MGTEYSIYIGWLLKCHSIRPVIFAKIFFVILSPEYYVLILNSVIMSLFCFINVSSVTMCLKGVWRINFQTLFICPWVTVIFYVPLAVTFIVLFLKTVWLPLQLLKHNPVYLWFSAILLERWKCQAGWQLMNWVFTSSSHWFYQKPFSYKFEIIIFGGMRSLAFFERRIDTSQNGNWHLEGADLTMELQSVQWKET